MSPSFPRTFCTMKPPGPFSPRRVAAMERCERCAGCGQMTDGLHSAPYLPCVCDKCRPHCKGKMRSARPLEVQ